jgi:hypothetical protein
MDRDALLGYASWTIAALLGLTVVAIVVGSLIHWFG